MAKDVEVSCTYCSNKKLFVDYVSMRNAGWNIFGWKIHTYVPYVKCPSCSSKNTDELPTTDNEESVNTEYEVKKNKRLIKSKKEVKPKKNILKKKNQLKKTRKVKKK